MEARMEAPELSSPARAQVSGSPSGILFDRGSAEPPLVRSRSRVAFTEAEAGESSVPAAIESQGIIHVEQLLARPPETPYAVDQRMSHAAYSSGRSAAPPPPLEKKTSNQILDGPKELADSLESANFHADQATLTKFGNTLSTLERNLKNHLRPIVAYGALNSDFRAEITDDSAAGDGSSAHDEARADEASAAAVFTRAIGGKAANEALVAAALIPSLSANMLQPKVAFIGCVALDEDGYSMLELLESRASARLDTK